jgi:ferredoxin
MGEANALARDEALSAAAQYEVNPSALIEYQSRGRVIIIGGEEAIEFAPRLAEKGLRPEVLLTGGELEPGASVIPVGGRLLKVSGYLGKFVIELGEQGKHNYQILEADLILDLENKPILEVEIKPPGYLLADSANELSLLNALNQLAELVGTFEKPRYFDYKADICAHGRAGQQACSRCIDSCPTNAITSLAESIEVDPYLCQGGGVCATVCPTGAIRYVYPDAASLLNRLRVILNLYREAGGADPVVCFISDADNELVGAWPDNFLPVVLEELASAGMDIWLSTLAYGARSVRLVNGGSVPASVAGAINAQLNITLTLLQGMGYEDGVISMIGADELMLDKPGMPDIAAAGHAGLNDKRQTMYLALDHLVDKAGQPSQEIKLPPGAPFGTIRVDSEKCTLCMGCTSVCPAKAIMAGNDVPRLQFIEANCVQCGLCSSACPELAIDLQARFLTDREQRQALVTLNEEEPFLCVSCGKPFATQSIINSVMAKLGGHWMYQSERALRRLQMCEDCRVYDVVQDEEAMQPPKGRTGQDDPLKQH